MTLLKTQNEQLNTDKLYLANSLADISHQLKTPLTSISGYAEIMKNGLVKPQDIQRFSEKIFSESRRLIDLIEDIIKL